MRSDLACMGIDPGPGWSAYCLLSPAAEILDFGKVPNDRMFAVLRSASEHTSEFVCERIRFQGYGRPAGNETFETCEWAGQFCNEVRHLEVEWHWLTRSAIKSAICGNAKTKDKDVRGALIARFGGEPSVWRGRQRKIMAADEWSALAAAIVWQDRLRAGVQLPLE